MTSYNVINPASLVAGQPEDVSQILANLNAIAAVINGNIDNANIAVAAAIAYSKLALANSIARGDMAAGNKTTVSTMAGGPPGAPADGDIWIATAVDANGTRWAFQYNAGSASAFKWEFIGGPPVYSQVVTAEAANFNNVYGNLATDGPLVTMARAGDYTAIATAVAVAGIGADNLFMGIANGNANPAFFSEATLNAGIIGELAAQGVFAGIVAATTIKMRYKGGNQNNTWSNRSLFVTPVRVS